MLNKIPFQSAIIALLTILSAVILFHILVLLQVIPYTIVWGGKFENAEQMRSFEFTSIGVNLLLISLVAIKGNYLKVQFPPRMLNFLLWLFVFLFSLNTVGNLFAETMTEKITFTPLTIVLAVLCLRIATDKNIRSFNS